MQNDLSTAVFWRPLWPIGLQPAFFFINVFHIFIKLSIPFFFYLKHTLNILFYDILEIDTIPSGSRKMEKSITFFNIASDYTKIMPQFIHFYEYHLTSCVNNSGQPEYMVSF